MNFIVGLLMKLRFLSVDIAVGGVLCTLALARLENIKMPLSVPLCLFLAIWCIYTLDHLMDAMRLDNPSMPRHRFHKIHKQWIIVLLILGVFSGVIVAASLPAMILWYGIGLTIAIGLYFLLLYFIKSFIPKEILIGLGYTIGIFLGPYSMIEHISAKWLFLFVEFTTIAVYNLILFSYIEKEEDITDGSQSWATHFNEQSIELHLLSLFAICGATAIIGLIIYSYDVYFLVFQLIILLMIISLVGVKINARKIINSENYRLLADMVFFFPGVLLLC